MKEGEYVYGLHLEVAEKGVVPAAVPIDVRFEGFESLLSCDYRKHKVGDGKNDSSNRFNTVFWNSARNPLMNFYRRIIHKLIVLLITYGAKSTWTLYVEFISEISECSSFGLGGRR